MAGTPPVTRPSQPSTPKGAARDQGDPSTNNAGQQPHQNIGTAEPTTQRAAKALCKVANDALAVLETFAGLLDRAGRGETIAATELAALRPTVEASKTAMKGVVAGFAAKDLCAELQQTRKTGSTNATRTEMAKGTRKTYAQAANAARTQS